MSQASKKATKPTDHFQNIQRGGRLEWGGTKGVVGYHHHHHGRA